VEVKKATVFLFRGILLKTAERGWTLWKEQMMDLLFRMKI